MPIALPIHEVVFELFPAGAVWTDASLQALRAKLPSFDGLVEELTPFQVEFQLGPNHSTGPHQKKGPVRKRLWNSVRSRAVQVGEDVCALNVLPPYEGFSQHLPVFEQLVRAYFESARPTSLNVLGQRYVNVLELPSKDESPKEYLEIYPDASFLGPGHRAFALQFEFESFPRGGVFVNLSFQGLADNLRPRYALDLYARSTGAIVCTPEAVIEWQRDAHEFIRKAFDGSITKKCRQHFGIGLT